MAKVDSHPFFTQLESHTADSMEVLIGLLDNVAALPAIKHIRGTARAAMGVRKGQRLLDAGCGLGEEARELARTVGPDGEVTAVDLSSAMVALAEQRDNDTGVRYLVGDITALGFPDATFDAVRSERVIQHLPDPEAAIAELIRVAAPGGRICLIDTDWESLLMEGMPAGYQREIRLLAKSIGVELKPAGRLLRSQLVRAGLTSVTAEPIAIPMSDRHAAGTLLHPFFSPRPFSRLTNLPREQTDSWFTAFDHALARNDFLAVLTIWVVTGIKPPDNSRSSF